MSGRSTALAPGGMTTAAGTMLGDGGIGWLAVIGAIGRELADGVADLTEQRLHLRGVAGILVGHDMSDLATVGIQRQVQFAPSPMGLGTMLLFQPLAGAVDLQPGAVDEAMDGPLSCEPRTLPFVRPSPIVCPTAQRRMVGNDQIERCSKCFRAI